MKIGKMLGYSFYLHRKGRFDLSRVFCFRNFLFNSVVVLNVKYCIFRLTISISHLLEKKIQKDMAKQNSEKGFLILFSIFLTRLLAFRTQC